MHNSLPSTFHKTPLSAKRQRFQQHLTAKYTSSQEKFLKRPIIEYPVTSYGVKGRKRLQFISDNVKEIKRPRNDRIGFFRPYTAPQKEKILLNQHLLKTQDFKEILKEGQDFANSTFEHQTMHLQSESTEEPFFRKGVKKLAESPVREEPAKQKSSNDEKSYQSLLEKKEANFGYFVTSVDISNASHLRKFPARPQSSKVAMSKKRSPNANFLSPSFAAQTRNTAGLDLTNGFFDRANRQFIRAKPMATPAILFDKIVRKIHQVDNSHRSFAVRPVTSEGLNKSLAESQRNLRILKGLEEKKGLMEKGSFYSANPVDVKQQDKRISGFNVAKLINKL